MPNDASPDVAALLARLGLPDGSEPAPAMTQAQFDQILHHVEAEALDEYKKDVLEGRLETALPTPVLDEQFVALAAAYAGEAAEILSSRARLGEYREAVGFARRALRLLGYRFDKGLPVATLVSDDCRLLSVYYLRRVRGILTGEDRHTERLEQDAFWASSFLGLSARERFQRSRYERLVKHLEAVAQPDVTRVHGAGASGSDASERRRPCHGS